MAGKQPKASTAKKRAKAKPKSAAAKPGRPSKYSQAVVESICEQLATGVPMAQICRQDGMPAYRTVKDWMDEDSERGLLVSAAIARAREEGFDAIAADCLGIADDGTRDYEQREDGTLVVNHDHIQRSKLRIETRLKLLAKWDPKRYGEKMQLADADGEKLPAPPPFYVMGVVPAKQGE